MFDLLDFARGPALSFSMGIFVFGVTWRLVRLFLMPKVAIASVARKGGTPLLIGALYEIFRKMMPNKTFAKRTLFSFINGWVFHLGILIIVLGLRAHIIFLEQLTGLSWPNLPSNVVFLFSVVTLFSLLAALLRRIIDPVLRLISTPDDYFTWIVTALPIITGLAATMHLGARYEWLLAVHILSICIFLIWFPFGKLMHSFLVFASRGKTGMEMARRGIKL